MTLEEMQSRDFLKGGNAIFTFSFDGKLNACICICLSVDMEVKQEALDLLDFHSLKLYLIG